MQIKTTFWNGSALWLEFDRDFARLKVIDFNRPIRRVEVPM